MDRIDGYLRAIGHGDEATYRVMVVADELLSNVARCAFPAEERHLFRVLLGPEHSSSTACLRMVVEDGGIPFDPTAAAEPDLDLSLEDHDAGGLGIHLVRSFSRAMAYERIDGCNRLTVLLDVHGD